MSAGAPQWPGQSRDRSGPDARAIAWCGAMAAITVVLVIADGAWVRHSRKVLRNRIEVERAALDAPDSPTNALRSAIDAQRRRVEELRAEAAQANADAATATAAAAAGAGSAVAGPEYDASLLRRDEALRILRAVLGVLRPSGGGPGPAWAGSMLETATAESDRIADDLEAGDGAAALAPTDTAIADVYRSRDDAEHAEYHAGRALSAQPVAPASPGGGREDDERDRIGDSALWAVIQNGDQHVAAGRLEEGLRTWREAIDVFRAKDAMNRTRVQIPLQRCGALLLVMDRPADAEPFLREREQLAREEWRDDGRLALRAALDLGRCLVALSRPADAAALMQDAIGRARGHEPSPETDDAIEAGFVLARACWRADRRDEAIRAARTVAPALQYREAALAGFALLAQAEYALERGRVAEAARLADFLEVARRNADAVRRAEVAALRAAITKAGRGGEPRSP